MDNVIPTGRGTGEEQAPRPPSVSFALLAVFLSIAFGANAVAIKMSLAGLGPFTNAGLRFTLASGTLFVYARLTRRPLRLDRAQLRDLFYMTALSSCLSPACSWVFLFSGNP